MSDETGNVSLRIGRCAKLGFLRFFLTFFKLIRVKSAICLEACAHSGIMVHRVQTRGEEMLSHPENTRTHSTSPAELDPYVQTSLDLNAAFLCSCTDYRKDTVTELCVVGPGDDKHAICCFVVNTNI